MYTPQLQRTPLPRTVYPPLRRLRKRLRLPRRRIEAVAAASVGGVDLLGFGNVCVDVRIPVPRFPVQIAGWHRTLMKQFKERPPHETIREPGGVGNTLFAAARLGLHSAVVGHVGRDHYGLFCKDCFRDEQIEFIEGFDAGSRERRETHPYWDNTSVCLVLVDPDQKHLFCSDFQVAPGPVFLDPSTVTPSALNQIREAKALVMTGYAMQECSKDVLEFTFDEALSAKTATFFDPGPFGSSFAQGSALGRATLDTVLCRSRIILATKEEAEIITEEADPIRAGKALLQWPESVVEWVVIKLGPKGSLFFRKDEHSVLYTPGFSVDVSDTVGCGDSFAAAVVHGYVRRQGQDPKGVMELANAFGAITATNRGAGRNVADLSNVQALLEQHLTHYSSRTDISGIEAAMELLIPDT